MSPAGNDYTENTLVEQPAIALFAELGWETANCFNETFGSNGTLGRETSGEVVLIRRLRSALERLNPGLPKEALALAIEEITRDRSVMSPASANREIYDLLKDGVKVTVRDQDDAETVETVRVIDWNEPANNDFFLASQFWISGDLYKRRADLIGFVNGLPLVFIELKASHAALKNAYDHNLKDYKSTIPHLFWYNALVILSNGSQSRIGSITSAWEHFNEWKRITSEGEQGIVSLETVIRGTCEPSRLLDIVENFTLFTEAQGGLIKIVAKNHQYLGVNNAIEALHQIEHNRGRLGVFWHTQGSGKSISMIFFAQKVLRKIPGNWTFVIVTDRQELDDQIYKNFANAGAVTEKQAQATSGEHLRLLLRENHRYVFTLIQKFRTERGKVYPELSDRSDIIVITDEAHRSQYDVFALNLRNALPNAAFIGFTGTPLMAGEEKTREVFGDYVSVYNFKQSIDDGATVPLYYENRIPELQLTNEHLNEDIERLLEAAELDEEQEKKLEREFAREYHLITRDDRLEKIAEDLVAHFMGRGHQGKAMVICIDKATAVRMYDKVRKHWDAYLTRLRSDLAVATTEPERQVLAAQIAYMEQTDMAVVVSQSQNEIEEMRSKGLDILPHRKRMVTEDLDTKFKDSDDPFRIVFVCAMWMTGFDVPSCSTIYLDKPMRNHTLMQTIARANRVAEGKTSGLIVDYVGVFRNLQRALAIYGSDREGQIGEGDTPVKDKAELVDQLREAIAETAAFCVTKGIDLEQLAAAQGFAFIKLRDDAVDAILINDESKKRYLMLAGAVDSLFMDVLPDSSANEFSPAQALVANIAKKIRSLTPEADISGILDAVNQLLDASIATEGYVIREDKEPYDTEHLVDLSKIDFGTLRAKFEQGRKHIEAERLKGTISGTLTQMVQRNRSRLDFLERFQKLIDEYNAGSMNVEEFFNRLIEFAQGLNAEDQRGIAEQLTEEELAIFDLLTRPAVILTKKEEQQVKKVARELLTTLKGGKLVLDWRKRQQSRAAVRVCIEEMLDQLPDAYTSELYEQKCELTYQHIYDSYFGQGRSIYETAA
ncbi:type I restriction endonuclease subunit R [Nitrolancea hollandica]|uniref:Type I restriction enzyme endonuclease subunit n=1 Tax=Nitrolancea hollandica Lb TaxID=1129897 RepID=I4EFG5_9BACT|nr:type I restriction endonuclease subunit R [Nitrolancea hollandica]CCF83427.1 Type I site-specific deoxyribonuclease, HsdR family [Nitrolancea hollandica Lb]